MSGSVTDLQHSIPLDERNHAHHPVLPPIKRNDRGDEVVGERELVIEQAEEKSEQGLHK